MRQARQCIVRRAARAVALLVGTVGIASTAHAQSAIYGAGLQAWSGCWSAEQGITTSGVGAVVCVVPTANVNVADVVTFQDGRVAAREPLDVTGRARPIDAKGCTGVRRATWSRDSRRVYLRTTGECRGVPLVTSGILSITASGEWLDVEGIVAGGGTSVRVARYRDVGIPAGLPRDVASSLRANDLATWSVRTAFGAPLQSDDVIDAARSVDSAVVAAWILERAQRIDVGDRDLAMLVQAGVPARVTDALAAVLDPDVTFARTPDHAAALDREPTLERRTTAPPYVDSYLLPWYWGAGYYAPYGSRRGGYGGARDPRYPRFYHPPVVIMGGWPRGAGVRGGQGRTGHAHDEHGGAREGRPRSPRDAPRDAPRPPGANGDPRYAPSASSPPSDPARPSGGTVRLGKPRG